jgi:hypothetical protein
MISAEIQGTNNITVTYNRTIDPDFFIATEFVTQPGVEVADTVAPASANQLDLAFVGDISTETELIYTSDRQGIVSPQTIDLV